MKKQGFTLIELLAVIVILAIIALISTPMILGVINKAKIGAAESSALGYLDAFEKQMIMNEAEGKQSFQNGTYAIGGTFLTLNPIPYKGKTIEKGKVVISNGSIIDAELCVNGYSIKYSNSKATNQKNANYCNASYEDSNSTDVALVGNPILAKAKTLVYDGDTCKTDGTTYSYMNGCYIKGNPTNNYVWYNGFMWRIMGINSDNTVRLISEDAIGTVSWGASNAGDWNATGYIKDWLNDYFYSNLKSSLTNIIQTGNYYCSEITTDSTSARTTCTNGKEINSKVGLISVDEYNLAGASSSYLNIGQFEWTITPFSASSAWNVGNIGSVLNSVVVYTNGVRPVINVSPESTVTIGDGTSSNEYILNENKKNISGLIGNNVTSGEYVSLEGKTYRVVSKDTDGIKLILDGYYEETAGTVYTMNYGSDNSFIITSRIGQKLNDDVLIWLGLSASDKIVSTTCYQTDGFDSGTKYTDRLAETGAVNAKIGLIRVGEMLSGQSSTMLTKNYTTTSTYSNAINYWTMNKSTSISTVWSVGRSGNAFSNDVTNLQGIRPVIKVRNNLTIHGGNGTWNSPYEI